MKITFKRTPEQIELIKAVGSHDKETSLDALQALAAFITPIIQTVVRQAGTAGIIYQDMPFDEDDSPSIPLDLFHDESTESFITTWSQNIAGGLPSSKLEGTAEMKIATYRLDTAVNWLKKYARRSRIDVVAKGVERMAQEILLKQERNAWAVIMKALAEANTNGNKHVITSSTESVFKVNDLSRLITRLRRINSSWAQGTPSNFDSKGLTDLFVSPEILEQIRAFAFNPMNTQASDGTALVTTDESGSEGIPLDDTTRREIFSAGGANSIYGIAIQDMLELGASARYNTLFDEFAGGDTDLGQGGAFDTSDDEILVGFDLSRDAFIRPVATIAESGGEFATFADDQWVARSERVGLYGFLEEGRVCIDSRGVCGMTV